MKINQILFLMLLSIVSLLFIFSGGGKVIGIEEAIQQNQSLNLDLWFIKTIGFLELLGVGGLWFNKLRPYAAICLMVIMIGAIGAHIGAAQPENVVPATVIFSILMIIMVLDNKSRLTLKQF